MSLPEEEVRKQVAAGEEGPASYRGFDPLIQYLLHRLDSIEAGLRSEIIGMRQEMTGMRQEMTAEVANLRQEMRGELNSLRQEIAGVKREVGTRVDSLHQELHSTTRWIIGTIIAAAGVAVALVQLLK